MKFILGSIVIIVGALMVIKHTWFVNSFGRSAWAEQHLGSGGTYLMYKLLGVVIIILSLMSMTGLTEKLILAIFGSLFGLS